MPQHSSRDYDSQDRQGGRRDAHDSRRARAAVPEDAAADGPVSTGVIKTLNMDRGFGFIKEQSGQEYFFHRSETQGAFDTFRQGDTVQFQPMRSGKGPRAHTVVRVE